MPTIAPPPNVPLTLTELRKMDGEPIWVVDATDSEEYWALVFDVSDEGISVSTKSTGDVFKAFRDYGRNWFACRSKPEEGKMKPILFNADMVRAILDGRKKVTRRVVPPKQLPIQTVQFPGQPFLLFMGIGEKLPVFPVNVHIIGRGARPQAEQLGKE